MMIASNIPSDPPRFAYRPDIDGLRAVAVLAVVFFHLGVSHLEGGFLGVDVFFVISGFLITSIIAPKMSAGTFSFKSFYLGRIRRLLPPALVTIAFTFLACAFLLDPVDLIAMAKSAIAAVFSVSNILFFSEAGYWDAQSELKPLLHMWSLGVEEQFYLFWPLLVLVFWRLSSKLSLVWAFGFATILGLLVSEWILRLNPSAAFYLLPARFFEFSIGATFAVVVKTPAWQRIASEGIRLILAIVGLVVLLGAIWTYKADTSFPGMNAILPCLATCALLISGAGEGKVNIIARCLSSSAMRWLGRVSYSLYLVHWPVVSLMRYEFGLELHLHHQLIAVVLIGVLTLILYYGIELRFSTRAGQAAEPSPEDSRVKLKERTANGPFAIRTGFIAFALSAIFANAAMNSGWTWRHPGISLTPEKIKELGHRRYLLRGEDCMLRDYPSGKNCDASKSLVILVFGDSHERDGINFLNGAIGNESDTQIVKFGQINKCKTKIIPGQGLMLDDEECQSRVDYMSSANFAKNIDILFYSSNRPFISNENTSLNAIKQLLSGNPSIKVVAMSGYFMTERHCSQLVNETNTSKSCVDPDNLISSPLNNKTDFLYDRFMQITDAVIDRSEFLCSSNIPFDCESETPEGVIMMLDQSHHTFEFAQYAGKKFSKLYPRFFQDLVAENP